MSAVHVLKAYGQMTAAQVAEMLGQPIELVYSQLVKAEADGEAVVVVLFNRTKVIAREWKPAAGIH